MTLVPVPVTTIFLFMRVSECIRGTVLLIYQKNRPSVIRGLLIHKQWFI